MNRTRWRLALVLIALLLGGCWAGGRVDLGSGITLGWYHASLSAPFVAVGQHVAIALR